MRSVCCNIIKWIYNTSASIPLHVNDIEKLSQENCFPNMNHKIQYLLIYSALEMFSIPCIFSHVNVHWSMDNTFIYSYKQSLRLVSCVWEFKGCDLDYQELCFSFSLVSCCRLWDIFSCMSVMRTSFRILLFTLLTT